MVSLTSIARGQIPPDPQFRKLVLGDITKNSWWHRVLDDYRCLASRNP